MTAARLGLLFAACLFAAFAVVALAGPWIRPDGFGPATPPARPTATPQTDPPPPDDPFHPSWTPPGGRWMMAETFHDVAARHPVMLAGGMT